MPREKQCHKSPLVATSSTLAILSFHGKGAQLCSQQSSSASLVLNTPGQKDTISQSLNSGALAIWLSAFKKKNRKPNLAET